ncbi:hypothetical protein RB653_008434 [Dictyostelium firmibasis]|uniref:EGF-like domain-containing protein n=1 Tax=Dictyostelium firmibasis TaxID=79012 RepID=A0AAN7YR57_9MYCE
MNKFILKFLLFLFVVNSNASHLRFGTLKWSPYDNYSTIKFTFDIAYRTSMYPSTMSIYIDFGDSIGGGLELKPVSIDLLNDWSYGTGEIYHTYSALPPGTQKNYTVTYGECCRIMTLLNNQGEPMILQTLVQIDNKNPFQKINWSPVSGMKPIVPVNYGKNNNFKVVAIDQNPTDGETSNLVFKLLEGMHQPPGISLNSITGEIHFKPDSIGLYCTQVVITDKDGAYISIDFLLNSVAETGNCHPSCSNSGNSCIANRDCIECDQKFNSTTLNACTSPLPIFIYPPTPKPDEVKTFVVGDFYTNAITVSCSTSFPDKNTTIAPIGFPLGFQMIKQEIGKTSNLTLSWSPTILNEGSYVKAITCSDSNLEVTTMVSFVVKRPECGNGGYKESGICKCLQNWTSESDCLDCSNGYYGLDCVPVPSCIHGKPKSGILGDGKCYCNNGWTGDDCSISDSKSCSLIQSGILNSTVKSQSFINPVELRLYLGKNQSYEVPININFPFGNKQLDIYFLIDINQDEKSYKDILSQLGQLNLKEDLSIESISFGVGVIDSNGVFGNLAKIGDGNYITKLENNTWGGYNASTKGASLSGAISAAKTPLGWRPNSFRSMIIISKTDIQSKESDDFNSGFIEGSIAPLVIGINVALGNWSSLLSKCGFGVYKKSPTSTSWKASLVSGFKETSSTEFGNGLLQNIIFKSSTKSNGLQFLKSIPPKIPINPDSKVISSIDGLSFAFASNESIEPYILVSAIGFERIEIYLSINHSPTPNSGGFSCNQNSKKEFKLGGSDVDNNILTFKFTSFLSKTEGQINSSQGIDVSSQKTKSYPADEVFTFYPYKNYLKPLSVAFSVDDGCLTSDSGSLLISIIRVPQPPECRTTVVSSTFGEIIRFSLIASDFEDDSSLLNAKFFVNSELENLEQYGILTYNNSKISSGTIFKNEINLFFQQTKNPSNISISISYQIIDTTNLLSDSCSLIINVIHKNEAPVSVGESVSVIPRGNVSFTLYSNDFDSTSATFTIKKTNGFNGTFYTCATNGCLCAAGSADFNNVTDVKQYPKTSYINNKASISICYVNYEPAAVSNYASISFTSTDNQGLESNQATVTISIVGNRANSPPVATAIPNYSCYQDYLDSTVHQITGTDPDIDDYNPNSNDNNLNAIITTAPTHGILVTVENGSTLATQGKVPLYHYYRPNQGYAGTDSYSYQVVDTFKETSPILKTTITVNPINHKPNVFINVYAFTSENGGEGDKQKLTTTDKDGDNVFCSVVALPKQFTMYDSNGLLISSVPNELSNNSFSFKLLNPSIITPIPFSNTQSTFTINCKDDSKLTLPFGSLSTGDTIGNIQYTYVNTPPKSESGSVELDQDSFISFSFNGTDIESEVSLLRVKLYSLPVNGQLLKTSDQVVLTKELIEKNLFALDSLTYKPFATLSNWDTVGHLGPLDKISYSIADSQDLLASSVTMSFQVRSRNPPVYIGQSEINVFQNTNYPLTIEGVVGGGGLSVSVRVLSFSGRGKLLVSYNLGKEGIIDKEITQYPSERIGSKSYNFAYAPPKNQFGPNFDQIEFLLFDGEVVSQVYTIVVNVIHVNQPPIAELISYKLLNDNLSSKKEIVFANGISDSTINFNINSSILIKFLGHDIDNQTIPLVGLILNPPLRGSLYTYNSSAPNLLGSLITRSNPNVEINSNDGYFYVVFVPSPRTIGIGYCRIPFSIVDEKGAISSTITVTINVNNINLPPKIYIGSNSNIYIGQTNLTIFITNVTLDDPDSVNNNISMIVSIVDNEISNEKAVPNGQVKLSFSHSINCKPDLNFAIITCMGSKKSLNSSISTISVTGFISGNYSLKLFIDDLGYNAPVAVRYQSHLNVTSYVKIVINDPIITTHTTDNKTILSGAIAAGAAGAALLAVGFWRLIKKSSPPTDSFFDEGAFIGDVSSNPIYEQSSTSYVSKIYESSND